MSSDKLFINILSTLPLFSVISPLEQKCVPPLKLNPETIKFEFGYFFAASNKAKKPEETPKKPYLKIPLKICVIFFLNELFLRLLDFLI